MSLLQAMSLRYFQNLFLSILSTLLVHKILIKSSLTPSERHQDDVRLVS